MLSEYDAVHTNNSSDDEEEAVDFRWQPTELWNTARRRKRVAILIGSSFTLVFTTIIVNLAVGKSIPKEWAVWICLALFSQVTEWILLTVVDWFIAQPTILGSPKRIPFHALVGSLAATFLFGTVVGIVGTVRLATTATGIETWRIVLNCVSVSSCVPTSGVVHVILWGVAASQNRDPDNSWILQCVRCSCLLPRGKRVVCILVPLLSISVTAFVIVGIHWSERDACKLPIHEYLLVAGVLFLSYLILGSFATFCLSNVWHRKKTLLLWVFTSVTSLSWGFAGIPWIHQSWECSNRELVGGAVSIQVLLFCLGVTSGIVTICCRVEACFTDYDQH